MKTFFAVLVALLALTDSAFAQAKSCDSIKACVWNAITSTITFGKLAQYTDIDTSYAIRNIDTAITFEAWLKPIQQPGKRVFVGGIWGPNKDNNDVWVVYFIGTKVYFELSPDGSYLGEADNTIASADVPDLYTRGWLHLAVSWDNVSQTSRIYIDGALVATGSNPAYPIARLKHQESPKLDMQLGSCNSLYDDSVDYRTFLGQMDEIRLWSRSLTEQEIRCQRNQSLEGTEPHLELYYRCNDSSYVLQLCDATGHGHVGQLRSGARMYPSDRKVPATFSLSPSSLNATLICQNDSDFTFTLTDTSYCGNHVYAFVYYGYSSLFTLSQNSWTLQQNIPQTFTVHFSGSLTGPLWTYLFIVNYNRCGDYIYIPLTVNRSTELSYDKSQLTFDTLYVGCTERTYSEDTLKICNQSNRPLKISNAILQNPKFTWRPDGGFPNLPITLQPGDCWKVIVRLDADDSSKTEIDTLRIISDDRCPGSGLIPLQGRSQDVLVLLYPNAKAQITKMAFEAVCPGQISNTQDYQFRDLIGENINIDTMIFTNPAFFGRQFTFPIVLKPKTAYFPEFIRFRPPTPGPFVGQLQVICHFRGCTIVRTIDFTGTGISVDVKFDQPSVAFGNVTIGKTAQQNTTVTSTGVDPRTMSAYLEVGDVFSIVSGTTFNIAPGQTITMTLQFRPRQAITYYDTLVIFDRQCYGTLKIPVSGTGVFDQLQFTPDFLDIEGVMGCVCRTDTIAVKNITGSTITITSDQLNDPSGKFTLIASPAGNLAPGQSYNYIVQYCPNDVTKDRADRAYINLNLSSGGTYQILLQGTSTTPKLAITTLTVYGPIEVGWQKDDSVTVENISAIPVHVTTITVPPGYQLLSTNPPLPFWLSPRDSIKAYIRFAPTAQQQYNGTVTATLDTPCGNFVNGQLNGNGQIIRLDIPISYINYGLHKSCECVDREIPLPNYSNFIPMSIDSVVITAAGVPNGNATVYQWFFSSTGDSTLPHKIPPNTTDTLIVRFCPNVPSVASNLIMNADLHIYASTKAWSQQYVVGLSGRRELNFTPNQTNAAFPATRVDTTAIPIRTRILVPSAFTNPSGDSVVFVNAYFVPDQRVFTVNECSNELLPWVVLRNDTLCLVINFRPRAPKHYEARLYLETTFPCHGFDTTIFVSGDGFAPAIGTQFAFDTAKIGQDTIHITTCDTLVVPVMITRDMPQPIIDILFRIQYDSTLVRLLDIQTPYTNVSSVSDTGDGARALMKNARVVKAGTICYVRFIPKGMAGKFPITLDNIDFDSDSLVSYKIVAGIDHGFVIIDDPMIAIQKLTNFDTVKVRDCKDLQVVVRNPGSVPIRFDSLSAMPLFHRVISSDKPYPLTLQPGDSIVLTVRFCPRADTLIDTTIFAYSNSPCLTVDTGRIHSFGWAPPYLFSMLFDLNVGIVDTIRGMITDTVEVPIIMDRDMPQTPIDMKYSILYDRHALEYLSAKSPYSLPVVSKTANGIDVVMPGCDSIRKGEIARLRFLVDVPDSVTSPIYLVPGKMTSDSIFFIKPIPTGDTSAVNVTPKCNISYLNFVGGGNSFAPLRPNPSNGSIETDFEFFGELAPKLTIYSVTGKKVMDVLDGSQIMKGGKYHLSLDLSPLSDGAYVVTFEAGLYHASQKIVIRR
ncbi:MAG TPA: choice-of-anchor D domain-containing protein [Candidatus Kapabacteria bacterium]|nr:choice-of-anchor D domain-containing protein [Candidatus Kapabacteria bacterium]